MEGQGMGQNEYQDEYSVEYIIYVIHEGCNRRYPEKDSIR